MRMRFLLLFICCVATAAPKKGVPPLFDPPDQPFRMAPMPLSSRSIVVPLAKDLHFAYDTTSLRPHIVWRGGPLKLVGPGYNGPKRPFICQPNGDRLWGNPPVVPWRLGKNLKPAEFRYLGHSTKLSHVTFMYDLVDKIGNAVRVHESAREEQGGVVRRFEVGPRKIAVYLEAHVELGNSTPVSMPNVGFIERKEDMLIVLARGDGVLMSTDNSELKFNEEIFTEEGSTKGNPIRKVEGPFARATVTIQPSNKPTAFEVATWAVPDTSKATGRVDQLTRLKLAPPQMDAIRKQSQRSPQSKVVVRDANPRARRSFVLNPYYRAEAFALPDNMKLLITGMQWVGEDKLAVCTYAGEVWIIQGANGPVMDMKFRRFARGMNEPMGIAVKAGKIYLGNKAEVTRLTDTDQDGEADLFETVSRDWGYTGSYNSFSYGPVLDQAGNFVVANAGHAGHWGVRNMGWALRSKPGSQQVESFASGFREPNGIGTFGPDKDIFVTDNQGAWIGACKLSHVKNGRFYGHPASKPAPKELYAGRKNFDQPAVWFPYKLARSSSGMCEITDDRFGPFKGQLLVGDFQNALVTRVQLEKVGGEWQGAAWPLLKGFQSGVNRLVMGPNGHLYVGGCKTVAWAANAPFSQGLERVKFNGKVPFSVKEVRALNDGFELTFTKPVKLLAATDIDGYDIWQYKYLYHKKYGSPEVDHNGKPNSFTTIDLKRVAVSHDRLKVRLTVAGWKPGYVTAVRSLDVRSVSGEKLWHDTFYYTLNRIPAK